MANPKSADDINVTAGQILKTSKAIQGAAKLASRKSIMTMAQPGMYQYPIVASAAIDTDVLMAISRAYQITYASNVATAYSLNPIMYLRDTPELSDFVKRFHTNTTGFKDINIGGIEDSLVRESAIDFEEDGEIAVESATADNSHFTKEDFFALNASAWHNISDSLAMESLNDMYRPYDRTYRIMREKVDTMQKANEAIGDHLDRIHNAFDQIGQSIGSHSNYNSGQGLRPSRKSNSTSDIDRGRNYRYDRDGNVIGENIRNELKETHREETGAPVISTFKNEVVRNPQLEAMEPTMVNVQIVAHGDGNQFVHNLTIGVKAMPRTISSDLMIATIVEACKGSHGIFKFLKWTKGEIKTVDFILGFSASKKRALERNAKQEVQFMKQSAARKKIHGIGRFLKNDVLPTLSVVMTTYEVARVKDLCGVDLDDLKQAIKLMNKYYLLSFMIYDPDQGTIKVLFDCDSNWGYTSVSVMRSLMDKTKDLLNHNEVLRLTGRH